MAGFPSLLDPLVNGAGRLVPPWNIFFERFVKPPAAITAVTVAASPFSYTASQGGNLVVTGGTVSNIQISRGTSVISTGQTAGLIPLAQGDIAIITYSVLPTINFVPA